MKTRSTLTRLLICIGLLAITAPAVFAQGIIYTWTGVTNTSLSPATNWNPTFGPPNPIDPNQNTAGAGDVMLFDGQTVGAVDSYIAAGDGTFGGLSGANTGLKIHIDSNQTHPVTFYVPGAGSLSGNLRMSDVTNDVDGGGIIFGDNGSNALSIVFGGVQNQIHNFMNNGGPCVINQDVKIQHGGAGNHIFVFQGTGNWYVTNSLNNQNGSATQVTVAGPGNVYWLATNNPISGNNPAPSLSSPLTVSGGELFLLNSKLFTAAEIGPRGIINQTLIDYNDIDPAGAGTLSGNISGAGSMRVDNGVLTLSGQNTYTGSNYIAGGELIAGSPESVGLFGPFGIGGTISLAGGTLGFGPNNGFDYSSRFDTSPNQQYNIDTGGAFVAFGTSLASTGANLNKIGAGQLTLTATAAYPGSTTVSGGKLVFQNGKTGTGAITVADGADLNIYNTGTPVSTTTLTLGSSAGTILEFNNLNSTLAAPLVAGTLVSAGTQVININSGTFTVGDTYPLLTWTIPGPAPTVVLGVLNGFIGNLSVVGNTVQLTIVATAFSWTGAANDTWDLTSIDWLQNGAATVITNNAPAILDDTTIVTNLSFATNAQPTVATFNNVTNAYTVTSTGTSNLAGTASLFVAGGGTVILQGGANTYTGVTTLNSGTTVVGALANGGQPSDIGAAPSVASNIVFNSGALQYIGTGATIDRLFTLNQFGGTIDNEGTGTLIFTNAGIIGNTGGGPRVLVLKTVNTSGDTFGSALRDGSGATSISAQGTGTWILTGNNTYSGGTTINGPSLQVGNGGSTGTLGNGGALDNTSLIFNRSGTVTVSGAVNGPGNVIQNGTGTVILANNNNFTGGLTINSGTVQLGNGGPTGSLYGNSAMVDNGTLVFDTSSSFVYSGAGIISGSGNVIVAAGAARPTGPNTYTGWTQINNGALFQPCNGQDGQLLSSVVTNNGTLLLDRQDAGVFSYANVITGGGVLWKDINNPNPGDVTLLASNSYFGTNISGTNKISTIIAGGSIVLDNGGTTAWINGNVAFTNSIIGGQDTYRSLTFNRSDNITFPGNFVGTPVGGAQANAGAVVQLGIGVLTLTGPNSTWTGGVVASNGNIVCVTPPGTGPVSAWGGSSVILSNSATFNSTRNGGNGNGSVVMVGSGISTLSGNNVNRSGNTTVSNGVLGIANAIAGTVNAEGGLLGLGGYQTAGTLTIGNPGNTQVMGTAGTLNLAGNFSMTLNKAQAQSNSFVQMTVTNIMYVTNADTSITTNVTPLVGTINYTSGTLQLINVGPSLAVNDRFVLFSQAITGGDSIPITTLGNFSVTNHLGDDGSVTVIAVAQPPPPSIQHIAIGNGGTNVTITATNNFGPGGSWSLLATNNLKALRSTWPVLQSGNFDVNGNLSLTITIPVGGNAAQFFDLQAP